MHLRPFEKGDLTTLLEIANNAAIARWMVDTFPHPYTAADAHWWLQTGCHIGTVRVIEVDGQMVGSVGSVPQELEFRYGAKIGYWIGKQHWGKGYATQALKLLTEHMFTQTEVVRLFAGVYSANHASMRVLEKAGYQLEAIHKQALFKHGNFYDEHLYVKLKDVP